MQHSFSRVPQVNIERSVFNRVSGYKTTFDEGYLVPVMIDEVLPGDTFNLEATMFARLATPLKPIMDNLVMDTFWFFVPNRLVWENWVHFMGEKHNPADSTTYSVPQIVAPAITGWEVGTLSDYFGLPTGKPGLSVSSLWHRAYNLIYNEWFRDQNLIDSATVDTGDGPDTNSNYVLRRSAKAHDYFTSCLPLPQKGPAVTFPLGTTAPVRGIAAYNKTWNTQGSPVTIYESGGVDFTLTAGSKYKNPSINNQDNNIFVRESDGYPNIYTDLSSAASATINQLREAFQIQKMYEKDARGGTRYTEILRSHFGAINPDFRLQRPEYLGGNSTPVNISTIPQTSVTAATPQGNLAGMGVVASVRNGFTKSFTEHGLLMGIVRVRADLTYQQGIYRGFSRLTKFDFYWPSLAHLGEQAVLNKEIYADNSANDALTFGYQERWAEYRYGISKITGKFRSTYSTPLDVWHLAQKFDNLPTLSQTFIEENAPMGRVIAVNTEPHFLLDCYFKNVTTRPMPVFSVPGLMDHF